MNLNDNNEADTVLETTNYFRGGEKKRREILAQPEQSQTPCDCECFCNCGFCGCQMYIDYLSPGLSQSAVLAVKDTASAYSDSTSNPNCQCSPDCDCGDCICNSPFYPYFQTQNPSSGSLYSKSRQSQFSKGQNG
jgi:hypothetical protein